MGQHQLNWLGKGEYGVPFVVIIKEIYFLFRYFWAGTYVINYVYVWTWQQSRQSIDPSPPAIAVAALMVYTAVCSSASSASFVLEYQMLLDRATVQNPDVVFSLICRFFSGLCVFLLIPLHKIGLADVS